jgi:hypothetical protein
MIVNRYLDCPAVEVVASAPWRIAGGEPLGVDRLGLCIFVDVVQAAIAEDQGVADGVGGGKGWQTGDAFSRESLPICKKSESVARKAPSAR